MLVTVLKYMISCYGIIMVLLLLRYYLPCTKIHLNPEDYKPIKSICKFSIIKFLDAIKLRLFPVSIFQAPNPKTKAAMSETV